MIPRLTAVFAAVLLAAITATGVGRAAPPEARSTPEPAVTGPIGDAGIHGHPWYDPAFEVESIGYVEQEYFISGEARDFVNATTPAPYTTRIFVVRPAARRDFNGTVVVEWDNVTAQGAFSPMWTWLHPLLLREGYAFVSVSAQEAGVCCSPLSHNLWDPVRYADLHHPGDDYSFDIYSQAVQALVSNRAEPDPMGGLKVKRVIAAGQSQSANRLHTYITELHDKVQLVDGFQIHGGGGKQFGTPPSVPVMHLFSEREISAELPDVFGSPTYRMWELPGSSHNDADTAAHIDSGKGARNSVDAPKHPYAREEQLHVSGMPYGQQGLSTFVGCQPVGQGGNQYPVRYALMANLHQLDQWLRRGKAPAQPERVEFDDSGAVVRDDFDHPLGGVRLPPLDVPVARYFGANCDLFGHTVALDPVTLQQLYADHQDYVDKMATATTAAVKKGFLLRPDAKELMAMAKASAIPLWDFGVT